MLYGIYPSGLVFDYKVKFFERKNFVMSGDLALFIGLLRPIGIQYDILFGNREHHGSRGHRNGRRALSRSGTTEKRR